MKATVKDLQTSSRRAIAIVTNIVPSYRLDFYKRLFDDPELDVTIFCREQVRGSGIESFHGQRADQIRETKSWGLGGERLVWQALPVRELLRSFDAIVFMGNPRYLSTVFLASLFRLLGKTVVMWAHGHTAGANPLTEKLRYTWWKMFKDIIVYTDYEASLLKKTEFPGARVSALNNGLNQVEIDAIAAEWTDDSLLAWRQSKGLDDKLLILSCGRLRPRNQYDVLVRSLPQLAKAFPNILWCVIGSGPEEERLRELVEESGLSSHVLWLGAIYEEAELAPWFISSAVLVCPGTIGLSLMHAFGYGLPVLTHSDRSEHSPEFSYLQPRETGAVFEPGNSASLARELTALLMDTAKLAPMREKALVFARRQANTVVMAQRFRMAMQAAIQGN